MSAGTESPSPAPAAKAPRPDDASERPGVRGAWIAVAGVLLIGMALSLLLAWRAEQRVLSLEKELVSRQIESAGHSAEARLMAKRAEDGMLDMAAKTALLEGRVAEVAIQRGQLEELLQSLSRSRDENVVVDIEAAIRVALQQNAITGSAEPLVSTLKQSDERLARYNQPRLEGVRRAIARDLDRVKAATVTDISTLTIKLDDVIRMVDELPMLALAEPRKDGARPASAVASAVAAAPNGARASGVAAPTTGSPGMAWVRDLQATWASVGERVWQEARSLVRVTRIEQPEGMLLVPEQAYFLRENMKLRLLNARLALLSRQFTTAQGDLRTVQAMLERYFDKGNKRTQLAIELLRQMTLQSRQVGVPRPDDTLAALAAANAGR
jgi:uroporphyrin-III C-methyltransferase